MELTITRPKTNNGISTISSLLIDGNFECFVLEDVVREVPGRPVSEWKIYGKTAIPRGRYRVKLTMSNRFKRVLPLLEGVPGYEGVRIHSGNKAEDTEGCLIVGDQQNGKTINGGTSMPALKRLMEKMTIADQNKEQIWITIN